MSSSSRRRTSRLTLGSLAVIGALSLACGDRQPTAPDPQPQPAPPRAVEIRVSVDRVALLAGDATTLTAATYDSSERRVFVPLAWSSADPAVASVGRNDGIVMAVAEGSTTVTVTAGELSATLPVSVLDVTGTIAFTRLTRIADGQQRYDVLSYANRTVQSLPRTGQFSSIASPAWSPDGSLLAIEVVSDAFEDQENHVSVYVSDLYVLNAQAPSESTWRALTSDGRSRSPSWSADSKRLAYLGGAPPSDPDHGRNNIYVIDASGGEPTPLTPTPGYYATPRWSPDGTRLTFAQLGEIFIINSDGSGLTNVTRSAAYDEQPSWSPDGTRIVFVSRQGFVADLFVINTDGNNLRQLTSGGGWNSGPVWSPDGRYIAFTRSTQLQPTALYVMKTDDLVPVQLTRPPLNAGDLAPIWKR